MSIASRTCGALCALALTLAAPEASALLFVSTTGNADHPGLAVTDGDVASWDGTTANTAFDESLFSANEDVDAFHRMPDGSFLISTVNDATLGGLAFGDDDIVLYDPVADSATLLFDGGALFSSGAEDVDAVSVLSNGNLLISTEGGATLGGLTFRDGDLVEYDLVNDVATLFFDESLFSAGEDIDGVHVFADGTFLLSTRTNATLGGLGFGDDDIVRYDPVAGTATLHFDGGAHSASAFEDVNAVAVPEASLAALLVPALFLARRRA